MKTLFNVALLASLLVMAACGKKDEPVAAEDATASAAATSAPAADTTVPAAAGDAEPAVPEGAPADAASGEAVANATAANPVATATTPATSAPATPVAATTSPSSAASAVAATPLAPTTTAKPAGTPVPTTPVTTTAPATSASAVTMNGDPGTMIRAEILRMRPAADAPEAGSIAASAKVKVLARDGGWYQVSGDGKTGWVRMLSVRRSESATTSVAGIAGIASGRTGTGKVVTTTGVRGLDSGDLSAATFDEARIAKVETMRVSRADADAFARQAGLAPQTVAALPAPAK